MWWTTNNYKNNIFIINTILFIVNSYHILNRKMTQHLKRIVVQTEKFDRFHIFLGIGKLFWTTSRIYEERKQIYSQCNHVKIIV